MCMRARAPGVPSAGVSLADERAWLDSYHARVRDTLSPLVDAETGARLEAATASV